MMKRIDRIWVATNSQYHEKDVEDHVFNDEKLETEESLNDFDEFHPSNVSKDSTNYESMFSADSLKN